MRAVKVLVVLVALFGAATHRACAAAEQFQCARYCKEASKFGYVSGKSYSYKYTGNVRTLINSGLESAVDETGVQINCTVQILAISHCDYSMQIVTASIGDYYVKNGKTTYNFRKFQSLERELIRRPLLFAFNGKIDTICHENAESKEVLDIKRGILSVFQNSNADFKPELLVYESDITGNCETHYEVTHVNDLQQVRKLKNLSACNHRMSHYLSWQTVPYHVANTNTKSLPLLRSTLECKLTYKDILHESQCVEKHVFQPFSNGDNGALTVVSQRLNLETITPKSNLEDVSKLNDMQRSSLLYEYIEDETQSQNIRPSMEFLKKLEDLTADGVDGDVPQVFSQLVFEFQRLPKKLLIDIYGKIDAKQRRFYVDAISLVQTTSGIEVMQELYENRKITDAQMNSWLVSLNFLTDPTRRTLQILIPLTLHEKIKQNVLLALSSMIYKYCSRESCLEDMVLLEMLKSIERPLSNNCIPRSEQDKADILLSLKAVGNAGITTSFYNLQTCYLNDELPIEIRLAAIASHRRMRCAENENLDDFRDLFADPRTNSEVRIAAYLASMQCASYALFAQVKDVLVKEEANQVGSFIWTHLTNLQETSIPWKIGIRKLVENEFLKNKYNTDIRKYSRNYEASKFFDSLGAGAGVEANVIFSSESFLPRSAMLNFTLDLFGETINLLEVGARAEGFEDLVEKLVGHDEELTRDGVNVLKQQRIDEFGEKFRVLPKQPSVVLYAKVFGNEISYSEFSNLNLTSLGEDDPVAGLSSMGIYNMLMAFIKNQNIDYTKSEKFLDANYKIPTILGFPLQLKANGTATMGLVASGELNIKDLWQYKMLLKGRIYPSMAVQVACTMSIDSFRGENGVQYLGRLNSNSYIDGYANMHLGKIVDVKINVPKKQMDIFSVSSNVHIVHPSGSYPIQDIVPTIDNTQYCTDEYMAKQIGLQFCNQWCYVNASVLPASPSFPLTGAFKYSMQVNKIDTFDFYHLFIETKLGESPHPEEHLINIIVDTPNSQIDRKLEAYLMLNTKKYELETRLHSPFIKFNLRSNIEQEEKKFKFHLLTHFNQKELVTMHSVFDIRHDGDAIVYEPHAKVNYMKQQIAALSGTLNHIQGGDYTADLKLEGLLQDVAHINGNFSCSPNYLSINTDIISKSFKGTFESVLSAKVNDMFTRSKLEYTYTGKTPEVIEFKGKMVAPGDGRTHLMDLSFATSQWPRYDTRFQWENAYASRYFNNSASLYLFETEWATSQVIKLDQLDTKMVLLAELSCPRKSIDYKTEISYNVIKDMASARILGQLNKIQRLEARADYKSLHTSDEAHLLIYYPTETWLLDGVRNKLDAGEFTFNMAAKHMTPIIEHVVITLDGFYKNNSHKGYQGHRLNCSLDLPEASGWQTPWLISGNVQKTNEMFLSTFKLFTKESNFTGQLNWIEDTMVFLIEANDKPLITFNGVSSEEAINAIFAVSIYQHYELHLNLVRPYKKFDLEFFWDKERDQSRRLFISLEGNPYKGQYHMDIEYPRQKIGANVILLPSQVVMNVTWGLRVSQRIYLKVGSKYYDVGGLYFGELETPFKYLEKQQFTLKYYVVSDSFDVQSDISWRAHNINLSVSGSKSSTELRGNLQLNTTLEEIRRVGAAISHTFDDRSFKSDAAFDYNDHSIRAAAECKAQSSGVNADFIVESPTGTIAPILGEFHLNDDNGRNMWFNLNWQKKNIKTSYSFKSDRSTIEIVTPFEGIEHTMLQYSVINNPQTIYLAATVALFNHNNSITLNWSDTAENITNFWLDVTSPVTGHYYMYVTHSLLQGVLRENIRIEGPEKKDILKMRVNGDIDPAGTINVTAALTLLEHDATVTITHLHEPIQSSSFTGVWNERTVDSRVRFHFNDAKLDLFDWQVESNLFAPIQLNYESSASKCRGILQLPNDYQVAYDSDGDGTQTIGIHAASLSVAFVNTFRNKSLEQSLKIQSNQKKILYSFNATQTGSELDMKLVYMFYEGSDVFHAYNISGFLQQTSEKEHIAFKIDSTSINGQVYAERIIGDTLAENSVEVVCALKNFCDVEFTANSDFVMWSDKSTERMVKVDYRRHPDKLQVKLLSSYDQVPHGSFTVHFDKVQIDLNLNSHEISVRTINEDTVLAVYKKGLILKSMIELRFTENVIFSNVVISSHFKGRFRCEVTPTLFALEASTKSGCNDLSFSSKFTNYKLLIGQIQMTYNNATYTSSIACDPKSSIDLQVTTPEDAIKGRFHIKDSIGFQTLELELSTMNSTNVMSIKRDLKHLNLTAVSDYLQVPHQEVVFRWNSWHNFSGQGTYVNGENQRYKFTVASQAFKQLSLAFYRPDGKLHFHVNATGRFESPRDFEYIMDGAWKNQKIKFEVKNYFGSYYQTTFNLITPIKGWIRTSLDCTLDDRKIGIAFNAKNRYMSLLARRSAGELLTIQYQGETLLEVTSREGHMTLQTTSHFGNYRIFVQGTQTPGIYVFSILKNGENLISFMLQNYSTNLVLHYKGKLMAPELLPNNETLNVELRANVNVWQLMDFKLKKNNVPVLELAWENSRHPNGFDGSYVFQSSVAGLPSFKIQPSVSAKGSGIVANVKYPCNRPGECSFDLVGNSSTLVAVSKAPVDDLSFECRSSFTRIGESIRVDVAMKNLKQKNIFSQRILYTPNEIIDILMQMGSEEVIMKLDNIEKEIHLEMISTGYAKMKISNGNLIVDVFMPKQTFKANIGTKGGVLELISSEKYNALWNFSEDNHKSLLTAVFKHNNKPLGNLTYRQDLTSPEYNAKLHVSFNGTQATIEGTSLRTKDTIKASFTIFTNLESITNVTLSTIVRHTKESLHLEQYLRLPTDEFVLNASANTENNGKVLRIFCKPFKNSIIRKTINARSLYLRGEDTNRAYYIFQFEADDASFDIVANPKMDGGYEIMVSKNQENLLDLKFDSKSLKIKATDLGVVKQVHLEISDKKMFVASKINELKQVFFVQNGGFGLIAREDIAFLCTFKGELPKVDFYQGLHDERRVVLIGKWGTSDVKLALDNQPFISANLRVQHLDKIFEIVGVEDKNSYNIEVINWNWKESKKLMIRKDLSEISNQICIPVEIILQNDFVQLDLSELSVKMSPINFIFKHPLINVNIGRKRVMFETPTHKLDAQINPKQLKLTLDHILLLEYDLSEGLNCNFNFDNENHKIQSSLNAKTLGNITFIVYQDNKLAVSLKSHFNGSSVAYHINIPEWDLLELFDISLAWHKTQTTKYFIGNLQVESIYSGKVSAMSKFDFQQDLLDIAAKFNAPFLKGFENFDAIIYIPKEFQPRIEITMPNNIYKLYYNSDIDEINAGIVYNQEKFLLEYRNKDNIIVDVTIPDNRARHVFFKFDNDNKLLTFIVDSYIVLLRSDLTYIDVKTPHVGFHKFGYKWKCTSNEFKFIVVHPAYNDPLGIAFNYHLGAATIQWFYSIHIPFKINSYDFAVANFSANVHAMNDTEIDLKVMSNHLNGTVKLAYKMEDELKLMSYLQEINGLTHVLHMGIAPTDISVAIGNCENCTYELSQLIGRESVAWRYLSDDVYIVQVALQNEDFSFILHHKDAPLCLKRSRNNLFEIIWDLHDANSNVIGLRTNGEATIDVYIGPNTLTMYRGNENPDNYTLSVQMNEFLVEYRCIKENGTNTRRLLTPFAEVGLVQGVHVSRLHYKGATNTLEVTNEVVQPGTFVTRASGSFLPHDVVLQVSINNTTLETTLIYSNDTRKTLNFKMAYRKINFNGMNHTTRVFVLRHPASMIDYELSLSTLRSPHTSNGSVALTYMDYEAQTMREIHASLRVDHPASRRFGVHVEVVTQRNRLNVMATSTSSTYHQGFILNVDINDKDPLNMECTYSFKPESPSVSLMAAYGNSRNYVLYAGLPNEKEILVKLGHEMYGKTSLDAMAIAKLNTTQLLWMKMFWKNNLYAPFHEAILEEYTDLRFVAEAIGRELIDSVHDDAGKQMLQDMKEVKQAVVDAVVKEFSVERLRSSGNFICTNSLCKYLYENENLAELREFMKHQCELMRESMKKVLDATWSAVEQLYVALGKEFDAVLSDIRNIHRIKVDCKGLLREGINTARRQLKAMEETAVRLLDEFDAYVDSVRRQIEEFFDPMLNLIDDFIAYVEQRLAMLQMAILDALDSIQRYIFDLREIKALYSMYHSYINWLEELHVVNMLEPLGDMIEQIVETIIKDVRRVVDHYKPYLDAMGDALFGKYDGLQQLPPVVEVREHVNRIYHKTIWVWNYHNMTDALKQCVKKFSRDVDNALAFIDFDEVSLPGGSAGDDTDYTLFGYNYVVRPENRMIEISQPLPVEWEAFNKTPSFEHYPLYQRIHGKSEQFVKFYKSRYELIDALENVVVDLYEPNLAPATQNLAMIVGNTQYTTFNGMNYGFHATNCSFLLATDFRSKAFSLIVNYHADGVKSYEVLADDATFEIFSAEKVTMDGIPIDLPVNRRQVTILRQGERVIAESRDFKMTCHFHYDFCTVQLSGWLFGKTAGLLGTLDNERYTDAMTSTRQLSDLGTFLQSWQLQDNCKAIPVQHEEFPMEEYVGHACNLLFQENSSPLSGCFHKVPSKAFEAMCMEELKSSDGKICAPAAAYVHKCRRAKVDIIMPDICVTCKEDIGYTEQIFDGHNNKTTDVVFINELDCHNSSINLPSLLDNALIAKGFTGNRYAAVGYGGKTLPKPHVYTFNGKIWTRPDEMHLKSHFNGRIAHRSKFTAVDAMQYATNLEFRVGVSKLFVLTQCETSSELSNSPEVYNMLGEQDVTLHVLKPHPFVRKDVAGVSLTEMVSNDNVDRRVDVLNALDDVYAGLALSTNGTLFDVDVVHDHSDEWARMVTTNVRRSPCQKCRCVPDVEDAVGRIRCTRCLPPAVKQFLNEYEEGNKLKFNYADDGIEA